MSTRTLIAVLLWLTLPIGSRTLDAMPPQPTSTVTDVAIYGGTPSGIAAALASGKRGHRVLLIEPYSWVGGLPANGLTHTDFHAFEGLTGSFLDFAGRIQQHYVNEYGSDSPQARSTFRGTHFEPKVARHVFEQMLGEVPNITVLLKHELVSATLDEAGTRITSIRIRSGKPGTDEESVIDVNARFYVDASYEGDLMAQHVPFSLGREARETFGESLAPETADLQVQGYNFRLTMTPDPEKRLPAPKPDGYDREEFLPLVPLLTANRFERIFRPQGRGIYKVQAPFLPNGKSDINDMSRGLVRLSLPDLSDHWPTATPERRRELFAEHVRHNIGMLYFLQNDEAVPDKWRAMAREWGFCPDEYPENNHLPEQLYIREARRMRGAVVFTQNNVMCVEGDARTPLQTESIAMGEYGPNCHGTGHEGPRIGGRHTGEFYKVVAPYQIPYRVLLPKRPGNLIVPVAVSSSHVGFCALRLEPIWMSLGQASGEAVAIAIERKTSLHEIPVPLLRTRLHAAGAATIYIGDVPRDDADFIAFQWLGGMGALHGIEPPPDPPGRRGKNIIGQYYESYPGHDIRPDDALGADLLTKWRTLLTDNGYAVPDGVTEKTPRRQFVRQAYTRNRSRAAATP